MGCDLEIVGRFPADAAKIREFEEIGRPAPAAKRYQVGIRRRPRSSRLSQATVVARADIRVETLSRLENGPANPTAKTVRAILRVLDG
jgi:DNA-binding XRE family transcriptional regulator